MNDSERCEELRGALKDLKGQLEPAYSDVAVGTRGVVPEVDTDPDGSPQLKEQIRQLEQALRDEGCEPG